MRSPSAPGSRPLLELAQEVTGKIEPTHRVCNYVATGQMLPDMLDEIHYHDAAPADQEAEPQRSRHLWKRACALPSQPPWVSCSLSLLF